METPPKKSFRMLPFTIHATRGLLRDQRSRRKTMAVSLVIAVALLVAGLTVFRPWLDPHEHPWRFTLYWLACAWETVLVLLLALFDLLLVRAQTRAARKAIRERLSEQAVSDRPPPPGG
jgi:protein-S-isoprenylcysteine O-methyltransferase Ste14